VWPTSAVIWVPIDDEAGQASPTEVKSLKGVRIMAVEDEPDALGLLEQVLKEAGADVIPIESVGSGAGQVLPSRSTF
jgi:hypothetical protein